MDNLIGIIIFAIIIYLLLGAIIGGVADDARNESITDGMLTDSNYGVLLCVFLWPVLIALALTITVLNAAYLLGKKAKRKWWSK